MATKLTLDEGHSIPDVFMTHDWNVVFPTIPGNSGVDLRQISLRAKTSEVPGITVESATVSIKDVELQFPTRQVFGKTLNITFIEVRDMTTRTAFRNWMLAVRSQRAGRGGLKIDISTTLVMELYDATGSVVRTIRITDAWPSELQNMGLESPGNPGELQMTLTYDSVIEDGE